MFIFRCVSHSVQRNLRDYITLKTIRKLNIHILSSNSTGYIESFLNDSQIEGENLRFCQGIPHDVLRLRWTERMFIRCLTAQCEEIYRLFCYFAQGGNSYISSLVTALTVRCEVWGVRYSQPASPPASHQTQWGPACLGVHLPPPPLWLAPVTGGCGTTKRWLSSLEAFIPCSS